MQEEGNSCKHVIRKIQDLIGILQGMLHGKAPSSLVNTIGLTDDIFCCQTMQKSHLHFVEEEVRNEKFRLSGQM